MVKLKIGDMKHYKTRKPNVSAPADNDLNAMHFFTTIWCNTNKYKKRIYTNLSNIPNFYFCTFFPYPIRLSAHFCFPKTVYY